MPTTTRRLKARLDRLYRTFDLEFLATDPLEFVHRYASAGDREVVGLVAASLAYGRVANIRKSLEYVFGVMGESPFRFVTSLDPDRALRLFAPFVHRFNDGRDIVCLLYFARQMIERSGSIGGFFLEGDDPGARNVRGGLASFSARALALDSAPVYGSKALPPGAGVRFFFPSPEGGSACKRMNLYLRWMVRRGDDLDFGLWKGVSPSRLVIPLDTHIARISRNIGLTARRSPGWAMAEEITEALKRLDPEDPVKYDFSLCRLGILDRCPKKMDPRKCERCLIKGVCVL